MEYVHDSMAYPSIVALENGLGGLPWVAVLIWLVLDVLFVAKEADAASSNPHLRVHQPTVGLLFLKAPVLFLARNAQVAAQHVESASFAAELAIEPSAHHAAALPIAEYD